MKCFEVVQAVLDATYTEIPGKEEERDNAIAEALRDMSEQYARKLLTSGGPDFSDPVTRFAYVFRYVPSHAHWLYELIKWSPQAQKAFNVPRLRVTCLGGGPGSDLVGVLKYLSELEAPPALFCEIVDGCLQWKQTWADLAFTLDWTSALHTDYVIHDVTNRGTWSSPNKFSKSDIFTINFFASEIFHLGDTATSYLTETFHQVKPGAIVLINDNNDSRFYGWIDKVAKSAGLVTLLSERGERKIYDRNEQRSALGHYAEKFDGQPRLKGQLAWRIFQRP